MSGAPLVLCENLELRRLLAAVTDAFGHRGDATPYEAIDLTQGDAGVTTLFDNGGQSAALSLGLNKFRFYGTDYSTLYVMANGLIVLGSPPDEFSPLQPNSDLHTPPDEWAPLNPQHASIAALWDGWLTGNVPPETAPPHSVVYQYDPDRHRVIIEWNNVRGWGGEVTFQAMLELNTGTRDGSIKFNYVDVETPDLAGSNGLSATVGIKRQGAFEPTDYLLMHYNTVGPRVGNGQAILITDGAPAAPASISGTAFWDHDAERTRGPAEPAMAGVTVFLDRNNNSQLEEAEPRHVTGADGAFAFGDLAPGTYSIRALTTATHVPLAWTSVTVADGEAATGDMPMIATTYAGTDGADDYTIRNRPQLGATVREVLVDGVVTYAIPVNWTAGRRITFNMGGGDDTLTIDNVNGAVNEIVFDGGANATAAGDVLRVQNSASTVASWVNFTDANQPLRAMAHALANTERVTVGVAQGALRVGLLSLPLGTSVTVNGGGGNDTVICGDDMLATPQRFADGVDGNVSFNGGGGTDLLDFRDDNNPAAGLAYVIGGRTLTRNGTGLIIFAQVENVSVMGGRNSPSFDITGTLAGVTTHAAVAISPAGAGPAAYTVGPHLWNIAGTLTFAPSPNSTLVVNDLGTGEAAYAIGPQTITRTGAGPIPFWNGGNLFKTVTINGQTGNNAFDVGSVFFSAPPTFHLNGNDGDDTFTLPGAASPIHVAGGAGDDALVLNAGGAATLLAIDPVQLTLNGAKWNYAGLESLALNLQGGHDTVNFNGVATGAAVAIDLGDGNDTLNMNAVPGGSFAFAGGLLAGDQDTLNLNAGAGTFGFDEDARDHTANLSVNVNAADAAALFNGTQHLKSLNVAAGLARMAADGGRLLVTDALAVGAAGRLDLADNDMIVRNGAIGAFDGTRYDGVTGLLATGYDGGAWNGAGGVVTSMPDAATGLTTLAAARAADLTGAGAGETTVWNGETVTGDAVVVKYTYGGDTNFDGKLDADDYGTIDFNVLVAGSFGYYAGDFNFDGKVDADDYGVIDFNILAQDGTL